MGKGRDVQGRLQPDDCQRSAAIWAARLNSSPADGYLTIWNNAQQALAVCALAPPADHFRSAGVKFIGADVTCSGLQADESSRSNHRFIGDAHVVPSASVTPANNGDLMVQATSNTQITFKLRGTDGTVRSGSITSPNHPPPAPGSLERFYSTMARSSKHYQPGS